MILTNYFHSFDNFWTGLLTVLLIIGCLIFIGFIVYSIKEGEFPTAGLIGFGASFIVCLIVMTICNESAWKNYKKISSYKEFIDTCLEEQENYHGQNQYVSIYVERDSAVWENDITFPDMDYVVINDVLYFPIQDETPKVVYCKYVRRISGAYEVFRGEMRLSSFKNDYSNKNSFNETVCSYVTNYYDEKRKFTNEAHDVITEALRHANMYATSEVMYGHYVKFKNFWWFSKIEVDNY